MNTKKKLLVLLCVLRVLGGLNENIDGIRL